MNLDEALTDIAGHFGFDADELHYFASQDQIGGFDFDLTKRKWEVGSIWGVEGQVLFALVRATMPLQIAEIGARYGCSTKHLASALNLNEDISGLKSQLTSVDNGADGLAPVSLDNFTETLVYHFVTNDGIVWLKEQPADSLDLLFEDGPHSLEFTRDVWKEAQRVVKPGGFVISHDALHFLVGAAVSGGIQQSGATGVSYYLIEPADCGLAIWRKPLFEPIEDFERGPIEAVMQAKPYFEPEEPISDPTPPIRRGRPKRRIE